MPRCAPEGARYVDSYYGYVWIKISGKWVQEHRYVWETKRGRIPSGYIVHHKDEDKQNNRIRNLECLSRAQHAAHHTTGTKASEETRVKMSISARERNYRPEYNAMIRNRALQQHAAGTLKRNKKEAK